MQLSWYPGTYEAQCVIDILLQEKIKHANGDKGGRKSGEIGCTRCSGVL